MKKVYVIYKQGVYGHGVHGIFTSRVDAENVADTIAARNKNNYHDWCVYKIPMNTVCSAEELGQEGFTNLYTEKNLVYKTMGTR